MGKIVNFPLTQEMANRHENILVEKIANQIMEPQTMSMDLLRKTRFELQDYQKEALDFIRQKEGRIAINWPRKSFFNPNYPTYI